MSLIRMAAAAIVGLVLSQWATPAVAQTLLKLAPLTTYVDHLGTDTVGRQVAYEVRQILGRSNTYPLHESPEEAAVVIHLVSMGLDGTDETGTASAVAYVLTFDFAAIVGRLEKPKQLRFVNIGLLLVGRQKVREIANSMVAEVDASLRSMR